MLRLKELRRRDKLTQREIAKSLGVSQNTYSSWETERSEMSYEALIRLAQMFGVTVDYLLGRPQKKSEKQVKTIPVFGDMGFDRNNNIPELIGFEPVSQKLSRSGDYFGLRITDDSMSPRMMQGDILIVRKQNKCKSGDIVVLKINERYITVKKIFKCKYGFMLTELNTESEPEFFSMNEITERKLRIIGKVVEFRGEV